MSCRLTISVTMTLLAAVMMGACSPSGGGGTDAGEIKIAPDDHVMGSDKAPVTIIEYAAPSCPVCAAFDARVFPQVKSTYIDTGKVRWVFRVFLLRPADGAAEALARCLPKESYMDFIELLFRRQAEWDPEFGVTDAHAALIQLARVAGLTAEKADQCIQDPAMQKRINEVASEGATRFQINSTPTFIINGQMQPGGAIPWEQFKPLVEDALKKAAAPH